MLRYVLTIKLYLTLDIAALLVYHVNMIIKLIKELYNYPEDYAVTTPYGELICKISKLKKGYYIYNKLGEQIAQISFNSNVATLAIANQSVNNATVVKLARLGEGKYEFLDEIYEKQDLNYVNNIKNKTPFKFSVWGNTLTYSYDIYEDNANVAAVVPSTTEKDYYNIDLGARSNVLFVIMIALAIEKLNYDPTSKY